MINFTKLKDIRENADITQTEMAKILGVKRSTYSLWELGINIIPIQYLSLFADYFNYPIDYCLGLTSNKGQGIKKGLNFKIIGLNIKKVRTENNLSQENIASLLKVTQAAIVRYEKGLVCISTANLYKFCKEFNISLNTVCGKSLK